MTRTLDQIASELEPGDKLVVDCFPPDSIGGRTTAGHNSPRRRKHLKRKAKCRRQPRCVDCDRPLLYGYTGSKPAVCGGCCMRRLFAHQPV